ncbi:hypothetical protein GLOIN_2v1772900 [Rhizophagus clarus]|uniref:F-box domain-containing protein n=1 Tax=Rhizophagus clarus TaxID=94130 RepID=A0A8H3M7E9_9GLOM|nr:hypothetical protein GLOIN_2v1772900 [Rhizophagus clarus]
MSGYDIFNQWASYLTEIKKEGGKAGKVAKHMLVSLWGRLYSDGRRPEPHQHMAPFISAKGYKVISEKIRILGDHVKRIHTDGFIILDKNTEQLIERYVGEKSDLKIAKSGIVTMKNVMNLKWINFEEIVSPSLKSEKSPIRFISLPNEILDRIFQHYRKDRDKKMYPLLFVNKQWYYIARRLVWQRISLTAISRVKFTNALSRNTKPAICAQVLGLKFIGKINIEPDVYISEPFSDDIRHQEVCNKAIKAGHRHYTVKALIDITSSGKDRQVSGSNKTLNDFKVIKKPKADLILGLPRLWLREAKIYVQKDGIRIYGDFVSFCKYPPKPKTSSSSNSESEKDDLELKKKPGKELTDSSSSETSSDEEAYTIEKKPRESAQWDSVFMPLNKVIHVKKKSVNKKVKPRRNPT